MKKLSKMLALLLAMTMLLSVASFATAEGYQPSTALNPDDSLTLTLYGPGLFASVGESGSIDLTSGIAIPGYDQIVTRWNSFFPNVKLDIQAIPWSDWQANVSTAVMTGNVDIIMHGATLASLCEDLQPRIDATEGLMDQLYLVASRYTAEQPNVAKVSGIPYTVTPLLVYLDTKLFADYGIELPTADWTWEDMLDLAQKLTGTNPVTGEQTYGYKFTSRTANNNFYFNHMMIAGAYGGNIIQYADKVSDITADYKNDASMKAFELISQLSECCSPDGREGVVDDTVLTANNNIAIRVEQNPFVHYAEAAAAGDTERWAWMTLPVVEVGEDKGKPSYMLGENNFSIAYNSDAADWAWEFIKFMTTDSFVQEWYVQTNNLPNNVEGQQLILPSIGEEKAAAMYGAISGLPYGWNNATNDCINTAFLGTLASDMYVALDSLIKGEFTPDQAAEYIQTNFDTFIKSYQE